MSITNGYCTVPQLKTRLGVDQGDNIDDSTLESVIEAVSRWIDADRGRRFYVATETRYYSSELDWLIEIDDLASLTTLKTDPNGDGTYLYSWASTDYLLVPYNAAANGQPYTHIETTPLGAYRFPVYPATTTRRSRVQVVGSFGYSSTTPKAIAETCLLASARVWMRKDLVFGISGSAELGTLQVATALDRDAEIRALLSTIKKRARV